MKIEQYLCIVDDQADWRFILEKLFALSFPHYPIRLFEHGQALLDDLAQTDLLPSLILMDRHMPVLDGLQTLRQLKQNPAYQPIPVVIMSAEATSTEIRDLFRAGANSFVRKPMDFTEQMEIVSLVGKYWLETNLNQ